MEEPTTHTGYIGAAVAALVGVAWGLRQFFLRWRQDSVQFAAADASHAEQMARKRIVEELHDELSRMSAQNLRLNDELNKLQLYIVELTRQIGLLTAENNALKSEIVDLRSEVIRLKEIRAHIV